MQSHLHMYISKHNFNKFKKFFFTVHKNFYNMYCLRWNIQKHKIQLLKTLSQVKFR